MTLFFYGTGTANVAAQAAIHAPCAAEHAAAADIAPGALQNQANQPGGPAAALARVTVPNVSPASE